MKKEIGLIVIFLVILVLPVCFYLLKWDLTLIENRSLVTKPRIGFYKDFPRLFNDYFNDHFGGRNFFIVANRWLRYKIFGVSPNRAIVVGKDNWLFFAPDVGYLDTVNAWPFSENELKVIKSNLTKTQKEFEKKGIKFYFLVATNKQSIYPEYLPDFVKKVRPDSRLEQLSNFLKDDKELNFVDPSRELKIAKQTQPVFLKYDTHWNKMGAFLGYQKLLKLISRDFNSVKPISLTDYRIDWQKSVRKDLEVQMGVSGSFWEEEPVFMGDNKSQKVFEDCPEIYKACPLVIREVADLSLPKLVMFRDSFGTDLVPFVSEDFRRSYFYWGSIPFSLEAVEKEKPDLVIMELTERELWRLTDALFLF